MNAPDREFFRPHSLHIKAGTPESVESHANAVIQKILDDDTVYVVLPATDTKTGEVVHFLGFTEPGAGGPSDMRVFPLVILAGQEALERYDFGSPLVNLEEK